MPNQKPNIYDVYSRLGNIEGKLDSALARIENHDIRLNKVEKIQDEMVGKISIVGVIFGFVGGIITSVFSWFLTKR